MRVSVLLVLIAVVGMACGDGLILQNYCGRKLAQSLAVLCEGEYLMKRSEPQWPWVSARQAHRMSVPGRNKRGVVDECCYKPCSIEELTTYC